jgi:hypothetical protein
MQILIEELRKTRQLLTDVVLSIDDDAIDTIPFEGSWTAGQVLEHLCKVVSTGILRGTVQKTDRPADEKIAFVRSVFFDFEKKFDAPDFVMPVETTHNKTEQLSILTAKFDRLIEAVDTYDLTEECIDFAIPGFGNFTRMEWIAFHMIHTQRHLHQLKDIAAKLKQQ